MKTKKIICTLTLFSCICVLLITPVKKAITIDIINNDIIEYVNSVDFLNADISNYLLDSKIINPKNGATPSKIEANYTIEINDLSNCEIVEEVLDEKKYYTYSFIAAISVYKNDNFVTQISIPSSIVLNKGTHKYSVKSLLEFKDDIITALKESPQPLDEEIVSAINQSSMIYTNENLGLQISYPENYTYVNNNTTDNKKYSVDTVSFYSENDKTLNYLKVETTNQGTNNSSAEVNDLLSKGYQATLNNHTNENGLQFTVLTQVFNQNRNEITEVIYVLNKPQNNIKQMQILLKFDTNKLLNNRNEIESIINSIKEK